MVLPAYASVARRGEAVCILVREALMRLIRDLLLGVAREVPQAFESSPPWHSLRLRDVRSAAHPVGEEEGRVGARLEGRHDGLEARPREANGSSREAGA